MVSKKTQQKKTIGAVLVFLGAIGMLFVIGLQTNIIPQSIMYPATCSSEGVWVKFYFQDEPNIPECIDYGSIQCWSISPSGKKTSMGGYEVLPTSTEKINCPPYTGKSFVGAYITNEGAGEYAVQCSGTYWKAIEEGGTVGELKEFSASDSVYASCPTLSETCEDGTPTGQCVEGNKPMFCSRYGDLYQKASVCGCPTGYEREIGGNNCVVPEEEIPPEEPEIPDVEVPPDVEPPLEEPEEPPPSVTEPPLVEEPPFWALQGENDRIAVGLTFAIIFLVGGYLYITRKK